MNVNISRTRPRRNAVSAEEERAWVAFYRRVGKDTAIAAEVLAQLDADPEMKREHLALYLCCRESLRIHRTREARNRRIGLFARWLISGVFVGLPMAARRALGRGGDVAVALLPEAEAEPATVKVRRLAADPAIRAAHASFKAKAVAEDATTDTPPREVGAGGPSR